MQSVLHVVDDRLANPGDTLVVQGHISDVHYSLGDHDFFVPAGLDYDLSLTHAGEGIFATGVLRGEVVGTCDRCLDEARFELSAEVDGYYLFEQPEGFADEETEVDDELDYLFVREDNTIDLAECLMTALIMETPFVLLCDEECEGLCPVCGTNLNHEDCGHALELSKAADEERRASNPFAVLEQLKLKN